MKLLAYLTKVSDYDKSQQAVFVILGERWQRVETRRFIVKVSDHNLTGKIQAITATKILPPEAPQPVADLEDEAIPAATGDVLKTGSEESGPSTGVEDSGGDRIRKASESLGTEEAKRYKNC
ncbi:unnamed protein product [Eruca vesicaria subsp. sativa]|uniref:Uncharacterized protein n=1 Tax=Eruca vesicaria subsp. sativa TaxID=29727 RepID=A0ABC8LWH9_ERUVS|nr:unnamed protein product [Eruca vesicaria subsp. sativa]